MSYSKITISNGKLIVPDNPVLPFIEGDGTGTIFGLHLFGFLMPQLKKHTKETVKLNGWRFWLAKNRLNKTANGCLRKHLT